MSGATWFVGDLHLWHEKVAQLRGFEDVLEHNLHIVETWHRQVTHGDTVWVLGDISGGKDEDYALGVLAVLPGTKHLIAVNHDSVSSIHRHGYKQFGKFMAVFDSIQQFGRVRTSKQDVLLSHYPYASQGDGPGRGPSRYDQFRLRDLGLPLIHAHTHHDDPFNGSKTGREMCVSWDARNGLTNQGQVDTWVKSITSEEER